MLVRFKSAFFDGTTYWPMGVNEIPEKIDGRKVVFAADGEKITKNEFVLPRSAELAEVKDPSPAKADAPMALSEISAAKPTSFTEAMKVKS